MEKYQSYKSSSVEWIGEIPNSWEETRLKYVGNLYGGLTGKSGEDFKQDDNPNNKPYIPYTNIFRNTYISKNHVDYVVLEDGENQNKVKKFDLFFLMSSETYQDLGKPCILIDDIEELYLNSFCKGFRVNRIDVNPLFLNYQLLGSIHKELISIEGRGFTRINLRQDRLNETPLFLPPLKEQIQIVQFLDEKTELIDKLISTKERKIDLLKSQRTSLINQVVTKGLNPNVKMKESGVEWIGEIPEEWEITKLKYLVTFDSGYSFNSSDYVDEGVNLIRIGSLYDNTLDLERSPVFLPIQFLNQHQNFVVKKNDILISLTGTLGKRDYGYSIVYDKDFPSLLNQRVGRLKLKSEDLNFKLFTSILHSEYYLNQLFCKPTGTKQGNFSSDDIISNYIFLPPNQEQHQIVEYLDSKTKEIDDLVQLEQKKIDLLKEYRQSLISEVVTGKIKVTN